MGATVNELSAVDSLAKARKVLDSLMSTPATPEELERATDRFWRSPAHQNVPGSGLGLAIVSEIVAHSDGELELELPEGGGLRIAMEFPVA